MRLVHIGDGQSWCPLKWARALHDQVELRSAPTHGFVPEFNFLIPERQRLALATRPDCAYDGLARKVLAACASGSEHMAARMRELGATEVARLLVANGGSLQSALQRQVQALGLASGKPAPGIKHGLFAPAVERFLARLREC
jgi:hypothetical protein